MPLATGRTDAVFVRNAVTIAAPRLAQPPHDRGIARERALSGALLFRQLDQSSCAVSLALLCSTYRERPAAHARREKGSCGHESGVPRGKKLRA